MKKSLKQRIKERIWNRGPGMCWPWLGYIDENGYGRIWFRNSVTTIHRLVWLLEHGEIPEDKIVLTCPILKDCCNLEHLWLAGQEDVGDRVLWKLGRKRKVPKVPTVRLITPEQVRQIYLSKGKTTSLSKQYGVSPSLITNIRNGKKYINITKAMRKDQDEEDRDSIKA